MSSRPLFSNASAAPRGLDAHDGILVVDKPPGMTSHDVVYKIRRRFDIPKVGHGGTLDPDATGVLIILLGRGTKFSNVFLGSDKTYEGTLRLGISTDSQDASGAVLSEKPWEGITKDQALEAMAQKKGDQFQTPPMVSAAKINGVPLYKLARRGETVERKARLIHVYEFSMTSFEPPSIGFLIRCTKGTYVRTLCSDVGDALGCGAHMSSLRRTRSGSLDITHATSLADILSMSYEQLVAIVHPLSRFSSITGKFILEPATPPSAP
jgi:tRNA pseudouridine55 synthase